MNAALARFLAVDYGRKRIGLAISDPLGMIASPAVASNDRPAFLVPLHFAWSGIPLKDVLAVRPFGRARCAPGRNGSR